MGKGVGKTGPGVNGEGPEVNGVGPEVNGVGTRVWLSDKVGDDVTDGNADGVTDGNDDTDGNPDGNSDGDSDGNSVGDGVTNSCASVSDGAAKRRKAIYATGQKALESFIVCASVLPFVKISFSKWRKLILWALPSIDSPSLDKKLNLVRLDLSSRVDDSTAMLVQHRLKIRSRNFIYCTSLYDQIRYL